MSGTLWEGNDTFTLYIRHSHYDALETLNSPVTCKGIIIPILGMSKALEKLISKLLTVLQLEVTGSDLHSGTDTQS